MARVMTGTAKPRAVSLLMLNASMWRVKEEVRRWDEGVSRHTEVDTPLNHIIIT